MQAWFGGAVCLVFPIFGAGSWGDLSFFPLPDLLFFPCALEDPPFILLVTSVFTRIHSGAAGVVDGGGGVDRSLAGSGGGGALDPSGDSQSQATGAIEKP